MSVSAWALPARAVLATVMLTMSSTSVLVRAAYKCEVCVTSPKEDPGGTMTPASTSTDAFCPENSWYNCLDNAAPGNTWSDADAAARKEYTDTTSEIAGTGVSISSDCKSALKKWICSTHFPVCEASTHGRGVCNTEFAAVIEPECPGLFLSGDATNGKRFLAENESDIGARLANELSTAGTHNGTVISSDHGSCFRLGYSGPNYWNWVIGFLLCMVFAAMSPLALNLQKNSIMENDSLPKHEQLPVYRQRKWMCAVVILVSCSLVDFVAYGLAPQSLLTPLGAMVLVYNMAIARFYGEVVGRVEIIATGIISVGTILCIVFADHYTPSYSFSDILSLWYTPHMGWYCVLVPLLAVLHAVPGYYIMKEGLMHHPVQGAKYARILCVCYSGAAGIIGAQAILFAKQTMELLKAWGLGEPIWAHVEVYFIIVGIPAGMVGNLTFLNKALAIFDALQVVPIYQTYWMIAGTVGGFVYFNELQEMDSLSQGMFFLGALVSVLGIVILSTRSQPGDAAEGDDKYGRVCKPEDDGDDDDSENQNSQVEHEVESEHDDDVVASSSSIAPQVEISRAV